MSGLRRPAGDVQQSAWWGGDRPGVLRAASESRCVWAGSPLGPIWTRGPRGGMSEHDRHHLHPVFLGGLLLLAFLAASSVRL